MGLASKAVQAANDSIMAVVEGIEEAVLEVLAVDEVPLAARVHTCSSIRCPGGEVDPFGWPHSLPMKLR